VRSFDPLAGHLRPYSDAPGRGDARRVAKILLVLNGPAYGADQTFNALRLAIALTRREDTEVSVFLMGDAVTCAIAGQKTPDGYYTLDRMLKSIVRHGGHIACCGTCLDARGLTKEHLIDEAPRSTIDELAAWTVEADQVLTF
jgi:uncharacterized protein involved in oxidation of intracellular sulfur